MPRQTDDPQPAQPHLPSPSGADQPDAPAAHTPHPDPAAEPAGQTDAGAPPPASKARGRAVLLRAGGWALRILLPIGVIVLVWHELRHLDLHKTKQILHGSDWRLVVGAIGSAFVAVLAMGGYDAFAFRSTPTLNAARRWVRGGLIFAWTNFLGLGPIGGPALRLFLYQRAGMPIPEILRGLVRLYIAFFAGLTSWLVVVFTPLGDSAGSLIARIGLALVLAPILAVVAARIVHQLRPDASGPWPHRKTAALGILGVVDWGAALATFALSSQALGIRLGLDDLGKTLYFGHAVGVVSMLPGGLGSADAIWLKMLTAAEISPETAAAQVLLFRVAFYIVPWVASLLGLYIMFTGARVKAGRWQRRIIAGAIALNAAVLLASSATPAVHARMSELSDYVPLPLLEVSHAASVVSALVMLFLVRGLLRGYRAAYLIAAATLVASIIAHLLKGGDYEEAVVCTVLLALLVGVRGTFPRQGRIPLGWELTLAVTLAALTFFVLVGLAAFRAVPYHPELWLRFADNIGDAMRNKMQASRVMRAAIVMALAGIIVLVRQAVYPPKEADFATREELDRALALIRAHADRTAAMLVAVGDKAAWFFRPDGQDAGLVAYQRRGNTMVVLADPIAEPGHERDLLEALHEEADDEDLHLVFYQISGRWMEHLHDFGYSFFKLGEEAIVHLDEFRLEGKKAHGFRKSVRKAEEQSLVFQVLEPPHTIDLIDQCREVSDAWLAEKGAREMQFSVGYFSPVYLKRFPLAVVRGPDGTVLAFVNLLTSRPGAEASFDLMRYRTAEVEGLMDYMVIQTALWAKSAGYTTLNLGMSPLYDVGDWKKAMLTERLARLVFTHGERVYNYKGLQTFKSKYHPVWEPRYLAYQRPWHWADAVLTSSSLILARTRKDRHRIATARTSAWATDEDG